MKLILDKNFIQEVKEYPKEFKKGLKYTGYNLKWDLIELHDVEANEIAPIVRFLATGKKNKISLLLIIWAGFLLLVFFVLIYFGLNSGWSWWQVVNTPSIPAGQVVSTPETKEVENIATITKTETETEDFKETSWGLNLINEVDLYKDMSSEAWLEIERLNFIIEKKDLEIEKLTNMVNNLEEEKSLLLQENKKLETRKINNPTDEFIYFLWEYLYKKCDKETSEEKINACQKIYYNFLENGAK